MVIREIKGTEVSVGKLEGYTLEQALNCEDIGQTYNPFCTAYEVPSYAWYEILSAAKAWQTLQENIKGDPEILCSNYIYPIEDAYLKALSQYTEHGGGE
jgi:hypothetical protein